jgi:HEAT repeat protein
VISTEFLRWVLPLIGGLLLSSVLLTLARAAFLIWYNHQTHRRLAVARRALVVAVSTEAVDIPQEFLAMPFRVKVRALVDLARGVTGIELRRVRAIAAQVGVVAAAESMTRSRLWAKRLYGARILTVLGPDSTHIAPLFYDPEPLVRAQAAEWATTRPDEARIASLVLLVYDDVAFCRFSATDALLRIGTPAVPALVERLDNISGIIALPLLDIAAGIGSPAFLTAALRLSKAYEPEVRARAANVFAAIGGEQSIHTLLRLLSDEVPDVRAAAARALGRLEHWKAAPRLAEVIQTDEKIARRAAAHALRALGAPGELFLRKIVRESDAEAANAAREAIDYPYAGGPA